MQKYQQIKWLILTILSLATSCSKSTFIDKNVAIKEVSSLWQLSDSSFFAEIRHINFSNNQFFFSDYKTNMVYQCSNKFELIRKFGGLGKGPGDLHGPILVYPNINDLYVFEEMNQRISIFDHSAKFINAITNDFMGRLDLYASIDDGNNLYCSTTDSKAPLLKKNLISGVKSFFGTYKPYKNIWERRANNLYHIIITGDLAFAISVSDPKIDVFERSSLQKLFTFSYDNLAVVKSRTDYAAKMIKKNPKDSESTYCLVQDVCFYKNQLFVLLIDNLYPIKTICNKILCFNFSDNKFKYQQTFCLEDSDKSEWYTSFSVYLDHRIVAFSPQTSKLTTFAL